MQTQESKIGFAVIITAIVVGGAPYYFWGDKNLKTTDLKQQNPAFSQSSKEYAAMGREFMIAFECSAWASHFEDRKEAERLFIFGYEQGKKFLGAVRAEKITDEDFRQEVPIGVSMRLAGPSDDFILGVKSADAEEDALEEVFYTNYDRSKLNSDDLQNSIAENKFRNGNCQLIGK